MRLQVGITFLLLVFPLFAHAETSTLWDFRGHVPGEWDISGLTGVTKTEQGLHIKSNAKGTLIRDSEFEHGVEALKLTYAAPQNIEAILLWHVRGTPKGYLIELPFMFRKSAIPNILEFNLDTYDQWDPRTDRIGIRFPAGTEVLIQSMVFSGWNPIEKLSEAAKSFWTFDIYRPFNINFIWGPLLTYTPVARDQMFDKIPPRAQSGNRAFYLVLGIALLFLVIQLRRAGRDDTARRRHIVIFMSIFAGLWVFYDFRMGLELFSHFQTDYQDYISQQPGERTMRERGDFYDFIEAVAPFVQDRERYAFSAKHRYPFIGLMRYHTYPNIPTASLDELDGIDTWVIYDRSDITLDTKGRVVFEGRVVSSSGTILHRYNDRSFVFRESP